MGSVVLPKEIAPSPESTKSTSSQSPFLHEAEAPGASSSTESETASAPRSRPTCRQTFPPESFSGSPSVSPKTRQPPGSAMAMRSYTPAMAGSDEKRTDGRNRDFARFEQVEKDQIYRLAEAESEPGEEFDEDFRVRVCDI